MVSSPVRILVLQGQGLRARGLAVGQLGLSVGEVAERLFPGGFEASGNQPVVRVDGQVAALGSGRVVAGLLDLALVLGQGGIVAVLKLPGGLQARIQGSRRLRWRGAPLVLPADAPALRCQRPRRPRFDRSSPRVSVPLPGDGRLFAVQAVTPGPAWRSAATGSRTPGCPSWSATAPSASPRRVPRRTGESPQEPADLRRHQRRQDDHAAGTGRRDS